jgi:DNA topoisomerase IB
MDKVYTHTADPKEVLRFQQQRIITMLFRHFLTLLEDLGLEHDEALAKLSAALPPEYQTYIDLADYLSPDKSKHLRKKVLDAGNDSLRGLDEILNSFNVTFKS